MRRVTLTVVILLLLAAPAFAQLASTETTHACDQQLLPRVSTVVASEKRAAPAARCWLYTVKGYVQLRNSGYTDASCFVSMTIVQTNGERATSYIDWSPSAPDRGYVTVPPHQTIRVPFSRSISLERPPKRRNSQQVGGLIYGSRPDVLEGFAVSVTGGDVPLDCIQVSYTTTDTPNSPACPQLIYGLPTFR